MNKFLSKSSFTRVFLDTLLCLSSLTVSFLLFPNLHFNHLNNFDYFLQFIFTSNTLFFILLITFLILLAKLFSGLYNYKRSYPLKVRLVEHSKAISLGYIIYIIIDYIFILPFSIPNSFLISSWFITIIFFLTSRVWLNIFKDDKSYDNVSSASLDASSHSNLILLIGGAGYIGSSVLKYLLDNGYNVRLLDLLLYSDNSITDYLEHPNLEIHTADFRDTGSLIKCMRGVDSVIHLGGLVGDPACAWDEELTVEVNLVATRTIAEIAIAYKVKRFIFASTCSVYGASDHVLDENSSLNPVSLYARSKIASEKVLLSLKSSEFHPIILRFGTIFGFSGRTRFDLVVNLLTAKAFFEKTIPVRGGNQWRPFVHVHDAAKSVFLALKTPLKITSGQIFNVGSNDNNFTIKEIGSLINDSTIGSRMTVDDEDTDLRNYRVCFDKIAKVLSFTTEWSVQDGITQILKTFESGEIKDYKNASHSNIAYLNDIGDREFIKKRSTWTSELLDGSE
jgi:nucleoside-diphosphate-sugar epimerase